MKRTKIAERLSPKVRIWLVKRQIPIKIYHNLSDYYKGLVNDLSCVPGVTLSPRQLRDLYKELNAIANGARKGYENLTDDELKEYFSNKPELPDWYKY
jgi:hypothetical protein